MPHYLITATAAEQAESSSTTKSGEFLISSMYVHSEGKEALVFENTTQHISLSQAMCAVQFEDYEPDHSTILPAHCADTDTCLLSSNATHRAVKSVDKLEMM